MSATITSNYPIVVARLGSLAKDQRRAVMKGLRKGLEFTRSIAQRDYLSGPRPQRLGVVTTRLRNSISTRVQDTGTAIEGVIGTNIPYAPFHEFGFRGTINVRAHTRVTGAVALGKGLNLRKLRGPIRDKEGNVVGYRRSSKTALKDLSQGVARIQMVKSHTRTLDYAGRPFIRHAIYRMEAKIAELVRAEIDRHIRESGASGGVA